METSSAQAERFKTLYDTEHHVIATDGVLVVDPYPDFARLRETAPVHDGSVRQLLGYPPGGLNVRPEAHVYSLWTYEVCDRVLRDNETFSSSFYSIATSALFGKNILEMGGAEHRRYRALVQPKFSPKRTKWWIDRWITTLVDETLSAFEHDGSAELNAQLCSRIPLQTITSSFGLTREEALDFREGAEGGQGRQDGDPNDVLRRREESTAVLQRLIADRRIHPKDDLITTLVETEIEENGERQLLSDAEILGFARLLLTAGSGTTWRQMGILLVALMKDPTLLDAVREDRELLRRSIDEVLRWDPTAVLFRRLVTKDVTLHGVDIPVGSVVEMNFGAANRDPARWEHPEEFDPYRTLKPNLAFAGGPHVCIGMHVARAEIFVTMNAVLDRLPNLRLDPDVLDVRIIGLEHRAANHIPVLFG